VNLAGIDLGVRKIAISVFEEDTMVSGHVYESPAAQDRSQQLMELGHFAHDICLMAKADSVWIESVIVGNNRKYSLGLAETLGAVLGDLGHLFLSGVRIRTVDNKAWKKEIVGNGNADKAAVRNHIVETHPAYAPVCGEDQDLYDAACIGLYGLRISGRALHLHLTSE
jgi:Holliday junction resolvasome RuvABC endonuclease subunit